MKQGEQVADGPAVSLSSRPIIRHQGFPQLQRYLSSQMFSVPGYLRTLDAHVLATLGRGQTEAGIQGGMVEIGVHHGKLFLILATLRRSNERLLGVDLFEDDDGNRSGRHAGRPLALKEHSRRLGIKVDATSLLRKDSKTLTADDVRSRTGLVRIVSIDGGHSYEDVASDLRLGAKSLHARGVIAVDDFQNADWPDVAVATSDFLEEHRGSFRPFLLTPGKLYIARRGSAAFYERMILRDRTYDSAIKGTKTILDASLLSMKWSRAAAVRLQVAGRIRLFPSMLRARLTFADARTPLYAR